jgi:hypothetical protein
VHERHHKQVSQHDAQSGTHVVREPEKVCVQSDRVLRRHQVQCYEDRR